MAGAPTVWQASSTDARLRSTPLESRRTYLITLDVAGRRSGRVLSLPLVMVVVESERYLVSMLGEEVEWVRNVRRRMGMLLYITDVIRRCNLKRLPQTSVHPY